MPAVPLLLSGVPLLGIVTGRTRFVPSGGLVAVSLWLAGLAWPLGALWNQNLYQLLWQSARAFTALVPIALCWRVRRVTDASMRSRLFLLAAALAWMSLNQFPFAAPTYFCYVAPLALIAAVGLNTAGGPPRSPALLPWTTALFLFGVLCLNRDYVYSNGRRHQPATFDSALGLKRATLVVNATEADIYRHLLMLVDVHRGGGQVVAGPDSPEVCFLAGVPNPTGGLFEFLSTDRSENSEAERAERWLNASVIVINHRPWFSPPLANSLLETLRTSFPMAETLGPFEVRWRG
jgi:hypothetical protein